MGYRAAGFVRDRSITQPMREEYARVISCKIEVEARKANDNDPGP